MCMKKKHWGIEQLSTQCRWNDFLYTIIGQKHTKEHWIGITWFWKSRPNFFYFYPLLAMQKQVPKALKTVERSEESKTESERNKRRRMNKNTRQHVCIRISPNKCWDGGFDFCRRFLGYSFGSVRFIWLADNVERKKPYIQPVQLKKEAERLSTNEKEKIQEWRNEEEERKERSLACNSLWLIGWGCR